MSVSPTNNKKKIGLWVCVALVAGNMIGSGIFLLPASVAKYGGVSILGWVATALGAFMTALVFVRLSRKFPRQGGPYRYAFEQFGRFAGFSVAWSYWISNCCGIAAIAVAGVAYASYLWPELQSNSLLAVVVALVVVWLLTLLNVKGIREAGIFQLIATLLKILPLAAIGLWVVVEFEPSAFVPFNLSGEPLSLAISATAALTLWAFLGLESATIPAGNVENPQVTIPRATLVGFILVTVIYISTTVTIMSVVPNAQLQTSSAPFADAAQMMWGDWAGMLIAVGAVISCLGALNGWILLQGQMPMSAASDGLLPPIFGDRHHTGVSAGGLIISSIVVSILVLANFNDGMVSLFTFAILLSTLAIFVPYIFSIAADFKSILLTWKVHSDYFGLVTGILAMGYCCWAISGIGTYAAIWGIVLFVCGIPLYFLMSVKKDKGSEVFARNLESD